MTPREPVTRIGASAAVLTALALAFSACGGDDGSTAAQPPSTHTPASQPTTTPPSMPPVTQPPMTQPPTTPPPAMTAGPGSSTELVELSLPTARSEITPTAGDLPNGVYRFTQTVDDLLVADPGGSYLPSDEFIGEFVLKDGTSEIRYFNIDGTPMAGEPPDTGGTYQVHGDVMVFATPPERAMPGTNGIYLLRWSLDGDTLTLEQIDTGKVDADFIAPWTRVGDAP